MNKGGFKLTIKKIIALSMMAVLLLSVTLAALLIRVGQVNVSVSTGYGYVVPSQVEEVLGITPGERLLAVMNRYKSLWFFMDTRDLEQKCLSNFVYADSVQCSMDGLNMNVVVQECQPMVYMACGEVYMLVDTKGKVLAVEDSMSQQYPLYGGSVTSFTLGSYLDVTEQELRIINRISTAVDNTDRDREVLGRINQISIQISGDIILMTSDGITVNVGPVDNIEENLFTLKEILLEYLNKGQKGYLDFTAGTNPVFTEYK